MKAGLLVGAGCVAVLIAALVFSYSSGDVHVPAQVDTHEAPAPQVALPPPPPRTMLKANLAVPPPLPVGAVDPAAPAPTPTAQVGVPPPPSSAAGPHDDLPLEEAPANRFKGESKELDYAEQLLAKPGATIDDLRSATAVFSRCAEVDPGNARCAEKLESARLQLIGASRAHRAAQAVDQPRINRDAVVRSGLRKRN